MTSILHYRDPIAYRSDLMASSHFPQPPMEPAKKSPNYDGNSSGSESKRQQAPGYKKRPSRAGTRSVTTLTAVQLERKRANDREAQRAIRQRTKDHIDSLERQVRDLTEQLKSNSSTKMVELMQRNEELERENSLLRTRLSHAVSSTLGIPEHGTGAHSPSDRVQMLSQPRRSSTGTARSVPEIATPVSQSGHWPPQHTYPHHVASPHIDTPQSMGDVRVPHQDPVRWAPHPSHPSHHAVSLPVQDSPIHAVEPAGMSYPSPYGLEPNNRAMSYPLDTAPLISTPSVPISGYGTPTSQPSPHPSDYQRHLSLPLGHQPPQQQVSHVHQPQSTSAPYNPYSHQHAQGQAHQGFSPQASHPAEMPMMAHAPHAQTQPQMMGDQGGHMVYHMQGTMKNEH